MKKGLGNDELGAGHSGLKEVMSPGLVRKWGGGGDEASKTNLRDTWENCWSGGS